jgi:hypothetical protein
MEMKDKRVFMLCAKRGKTWAKFGHALDEDKLRNDESSKYKIYRDKSWLYATKEVRPEHAKDLVDPEVQKKLQGDIWRQKLIGFDMRLVHDLCKKE